MSTPHDTVLSVVDLVDRPGASRRVDAAFDPPADLDLPLVEAVGPLRLQGVLESVVEGILLRGTLEGEVRMQCARCLTPVAVDLSTDVAELFLDPQDPRADADEVEPGYTIADGRIDIDTLLRDALAPAVPVAPVCTPDCRGLCTECGADLNADPGHQHDEPADPRWSGLAGLRVERTGE
jgi:uncharacterized protein